MSDGHIVDTKKVYLDNLARKYHSDKQRHVVHLRRRVCDVLDAMCAEFVDDDELLQAQGILVVYYLLFRAAAENGTLDRITRRKLLNFRRRLAENCEYAEKDYAAASFDLLEFDRLNQQGTNDASSIKERYRILSLELRVPLAEV